MVLGKYGVNQLEQNRVAQARTLFDENGNSQPAQLVPDFHFPFNRKDADLYRLHIRRWMKSVFGVIGIKQPSEQLQSQLRNGFIRTGVFI